MNRIHLKNRRIKIKKINIIFIIIFVLIIITFYSIKYISKELTPILISTGEIKINKYSTTVINNAISQVLDDHINTLDLVDNLYDKNGNIMMIDFNPTVVNQILSVATTVVLNNLKLLEIGDLEAIGLGEMELPEDEIYNLKRGIVAYVPLGIVTNITLLSNLGPKIPIRLHYIGDVNSYITTKVTGYGINNALIEIGIHFEISAQIILPYTSTVKVLEADMPIAMKVVQGNVPSFYSGTIDKNSSVYSKPIE